jgi:preprotein translocase subunit SecY
MAGDNGDIRQKWIDVIQDSSRQYDQTIILVASGAIGLSLAFINNIIAKGIMNPCDLFISWGCFIFAILANLISHLTSIEGYLENISELDHGKEPNKAWAIITVILNVAALILVVVGIIYLCLFSYTNIVGKGGK